MASAEFAPPLTEEQENKRWIDLDKLFCRTSPLAHEMFPAGPEVKSFLQQCRVLIVGAGGLGCDLVKNLALSGFKKIDIIDMDTIDITNLNRQFLFRQKDVGSSKAETAAKFVNKRVPGVKVTAHNMRLEEKPQEFYKQFNMVICGLDSIEARRNINNLLYGFVKYNEEGEVDMSTVIPYIDGGTEGFKGQARVIFPGVTACFECTMALFTDDQNFPICTIKSKPRLPEHCVQYALLLQWNEVEDKGEIEKGAAFDKDNPKHIKWVYERACERANHFNIRGVTYRLAQGVVKRIIPAIASTNAIIASACTNEAIKVATLMAPYLNDHMFYNGNGDAGIYTYTYTNFREPECRTCGQKRLNLKLSKSTTLAEFRQIFRDREDFKLVEPSVKNADGDYLYTDIPAFEEGLRPNLNQSLFALTGGDGVVKVTDKSVMKAEIHTTVTFE